jgi:hypothetical protein
LGLYTHQFSHSHSKIDRLYSSPYIFKVIKSRRVRFVGHVARMEEKNAYTVLIGKPEKKRPVGRPRYR